MGNRPLALSAPAFFLGVALGLAPQARAQFTQAMSPLAIAQASSTDKSNPRPVVDDREIALRVQSALFKDKRVAGLGLSVKSNDGTVELSGRADSQSQADRAVAVARAVPGVKAVSNEIRVN